MANQQDNYPTEQDGLLSNKTLPSGSRGNDETHPPRGLRATLVPLLFLLLLALVLWNMYSESHQEQWEEERLIATYTKAAEAALEVLNLLSDSNTGDSTIPVGCESTLLIFRHCEDLGGHVRYEDGTSHCSYLGFQRSVYLATLFGNVSDTDARWPLPSKLYGEWNQDGTNKRQYEILKPLSEKAQVAIHMAPFDTAKEEVRDEIFKLLSGGQFCNQVVAIAWKHAFIPPLAAALGCDQERGCPIRYGDYDFDTVWELQYVYKPEQLRAYPVGESVWIHHNKSLVDGWKVFGSVTQEDFDALEFKRKTYDSVDKEFHWTKHSGHS
jgi:hypothetical protein